MSKFTLEQQRVIDTKSGNLVVTASAGSGKTSVMTERFLRLVTSERIPVRRILCVTFTKLAAEELKTRLKSSLTEAAMKCEDGIEREFLFRQLDDLPQAYICTVDSFCNTLVRRYFYVAGVDPQFGVIDEKVADSLMADALDETFETLYEAEDENLKRALKAFCEQRSDKALKKLVLDVYRFLSSEADVDGYEKTALSLYEQENIKIAINGLIDGFLEKVKGLKPQITNLIGATEGLKKLEESRALLEFAAEVIGCLEADRSLENFSVIANADWSKPRITTKDEVEKQLSEQVKAVLDQLKTAIGKYKPVLLNPDGVRLGEGAGEILKSLLYVVNAFGDRYAADKERMSLLDFADLERYALNILTSDEARAEISGSFDCVFVDEYQDTSGV
ncbi:MAG: UvrD-helicase domain-containing protein, partial [Clostridia bacterium]|nr:UvrD-helicase domain-containing protein [Clostridia bacterium]